MRFYRSRRLHRSCGLVLASVALQHVAPAAIAADAAAGSVERPKFEAAIGLRGGYGAEYLGADIRALDANPALYLRYGRVSLSSASGLVDRRNDDVIRGLGVDLSRTERLRVGLSLRYDQGRSSVGREGLAGVGGVSSTLRVRMLMQRRFDSGLRLGADVNTDVLGRDGGALLEMSVGLQRRLSSSLRWNTSGVLNWGNRRYMRSYFGVDADEASSSGLARYAPSSGWRDLGLSTQLRYDLDARWSMTGGLSLDRLLGPARDSPFTRSATNAGLSFGVIYWL